MMTFFKLLNQIIGFIEDEIDDDGKLWGTVAASVFVYGWRSTIGDREPGHNLQNKSEWENKLYI